MRFNFTTTGRSTVTTSWTVDLDVSDILDADLEAAINSAMEDGRAEELRSEADAYDEHTLDTDSIEAS